jgi:hypothetical protein
MYTLDKPRPTNKFVGVDGLYLDGVFRGMNDSQHIPWPWSKCAVRAVKSEHIKGSWLAGVDKCVLGVQPWLPTLRLISCSSFHASVAFPFLRFVSCCVATCMVGWSTTVSLRLMDLSRLRYTVPCF